MDLLTSVPQRTASDFTAGRPTESKGQPDTERLKQWGRKEERNASDKSPSCPGSRSSHNCANTFNSCKARSVCCDGFSGSLRPLSGTLATSFPRSRLAAQPNSSAENRAPKALSTLTPAPNFVQSQIKQLQSQLYFHAK
ncbi:hypothetical protein TREES_T100013139 [Tupaia chinensis]|uniref:Uncharacterized protein n=1 Tax=Tupaia chinensis TaxID=246437 RepID=L9KR16_TUPCH|nr:hypothetical protein TREES_T100013139 [Tupaia chinensis]